MAIIIPNHEIKAGTEYNNCDYDIVHQPLFQTPLFEIHLDDIDNKELEKEIYNLRDTSEGICLSNRGGWHSVIQSLHSQNEHKMDDTFKPLLDRILKVLNNLPFDPNISKLVDFSIWANINPKGSYNAIHNHPDCDIAGVYYVKVPKGDCGNIGFHDPRPALYGNSFIVNRYVGGGIIPRYPIEGNMYLFPACLQHEVSMNNIDEDRISISFNLTVD
tara:strand:+ start:480 stop:1130 length:651 start_codon:yes stop_codon:yes gene_type:complete